MSSKGKVTLYRGGMQTGINKMSENIGERAVNFVIEFIKKQYGNACIETGSAFELYLENSGIRYNKVKTLADLSEPRNLEGQNGIYVEVFVEYKDQKIALKTIYDLMKISNNIVIVGSGGTGKSMIMRHLFVDTNFSNDYIPVLVELRKLTNVQRDTELLDLIHSCIESFDVELNQEQFEYSLRSGKYLFLLDGLDEVKREQQMEAEHLIQQLSNRYPANYYVISSRKEGIDFSELETYTFVEACPLEKEQAVELVKKLGREDEKSIQFAELLEQELFEQHIDFASNPLLLTMMYITFIDNNMIPEHLTDFYENAYNALYKRHDANKEGLFQRDYKCKKMGEREFKDLFSYFCFQSYFVQKYEFDKEEICQYVSNGINRLSLGEVLNNPEDFFDDIKDIVCLIVQEGTKYKFAHRSFQTYFAAYYVAIHVADEQQKSFFKQEIDGEFSFELGLDFYRMLWKLEGNRFNTNLLESAIRKILETIKEGNDKKFELLKIYSQTISIREKNVYRGMNSIEKMKIPYERNILTLFTDLYIEKKQYDETVKEKIVSIFEKNPELLEEDSAIEIEKLAKIKPRMLKNQILELIYEYYRIGELIQIMEDWVKDQDKKSIKRIKKDKGEMLAKM